MYEHCETALDSHMSGHANRRAKCMYVQLYSQLVLHFVTGLLYVTDVAHNRNAAPRFDYSQADKLYSDNDRFASSPPLQVITTLV